jgi:dolichol-phosphate mannosyltransferase
LVTQQLFTQEPAIAAGETGAGRPAAEMPPLSIIVPTRNEAGNVRPLLQRLEQATGHLVREVLFVDDSDDDTAQVIRAAAADFPFAVRAIVRPLACRNGLSGAVVEGLGAAQGAWALVMDADLQHPPELIPRLYQRALATNADVVVGSRLVAADGPIGLSRLRSVASRSLTLLARAFFPQALKNVSDPLTGLFLVRRAAVEPQRLRPQGFKILLEILVRCRDLRVSELHFEFGERHAGQSKAGLNEGVRFFRHLLRLRLTANQHFIRFLIAGALGIGANLLFLASLVELAGWPALVAAVLATQGSAVFNFALTDRWVFSDRSPAQLAGIRLARYLLMNNVLLLVHLPLMWLLMQAGLHYLAANLAGILVTTLARYALSDDWIWTRKSILERPSYVTYNIHDLLVVETTIPLPELEHFRTDTPPQRVDVQVRVDPYGTPRRAPGDLGYDEGLGRLGFGVTLNLGDYSQVVVSPLLEKAPHALYSNVVEPLLRWAFVRRGYALVHGTCVAYDGRAVLMVPEAEPDFKSILRAPANGDLSFLGDETVLLGRDGRVLAYPKPLLIHKQLLGAMAGIDPSYGERLVLTAESRIYSWLARRVALQLRRLWLPAATLNSAVQIIFPPPKYMLHELLPAIPYCREAQLAAVVLLAPGPATATTATAAEAADTILANAAEAYAFPPYPALAGALSQWQGADLQHVERQIICEGLSRATAVRWSSPDNRWWKELPQLVIGNR